MYTALNNSKMQATTDQNEVFTVISKIARLSKVGFLQKAHDRLYSLSTGPTSTCDQVTSNASHAPELDRAKDIFHPQNQAVNKWS